MIRHDFLLEIRTEEIPANALANARLDLARHVKQALDEEGLEAEQVRSFATPRRLVLYLQGLPERQEDRLTEVVGPPVSAAYDAEGRPTRAAEGFARAQKVNVSDLAIVESPRGAAIAVKRSVPGREAAQVLQEAVPRAVASLTFSKTMRWGAGERVFVRPVRGVLAIYGGNTVPLEVLGVKAIGATVGHPILSDGEIPVRGLEDYLSNLRANHVEPDPEARRLAILEAARREAAAAGGTVESDADLAAVLADLVEWPGIVGGSFAPEFLDLPEEITTTA